MITTMEEFREQVHLKVQEVPKGRLTTYGAVATALGSAKVARQVGWALRDGDCDAEGTPWWRVINSKGEISYRPKDMTGEGSGSEQENRLREEGIDFVDRRGGDSRRICDFDNLLYVFETRERGEADAPAGKKQRKRGGA